MVWLQKGKEYLPDFTRAELKKMYKHEKNAKAKLRLLASILRKEGKTLDEISFSLQKAKTTIHDWLKRLDERGINGIYSIKQKGQPGKLTKEQKKELEKVLEGSPEHQNLPFKLWTTGLVQYFIYTKYNITYTLSAVWKIVTKMNFKLKVPRQENKKINKKAREKFKKEVKKKSNITLNLDSRSYVLMKHTLQSNHT